MLTPGLLKEKEGTLPMSGSNDPVYGNMINPIEKIKKDIEPSNDNFLAQILAKERELAKVNIRVNGENVRSVIEIGDIHFLNKRFPKARDAYLNVIKLDKKNVAAYKKLINCYIALNNLQAAANYYEKLIDISPTAELRHEFVLFKLALYANDHEKLMSLKEEIKRLTQENTLNSQILNTYGMYLGFILREHEESKSLFEKAIKLDGNNFHAVNNLGVYFQVKNQLQKALEQFKKAVEINPNYESGFENIACIYILQKKYLKALGVLQDATERLQLSDMWVHKIGWLLIQLGEFEQAIKWHKKKISEEPDNELLLNNLGVCYQKLGKLEKAEEFYKEAINRFESKLRNPNFVADSRYINPYQNLMVLLDDKDKNTQTESVAKRLLSIIPNNPMALYFRGQAQQKMKNYTFAKECFRTSISVNPNVYDPYINLAFILEAIDENYDDTVELLKNAPFKKAENPIFINNLAYAYIKKGKLKQADELINQIKFKDNPSLNATRGLLALYQSDLKKAEKFYKEAISKINYKEKESAEQVWAYEQAHFWFRQHDLDAAKKNIAVALELGDVSYAYLLAKRLKSKIKGSRISVI